MLCGATPMLLLPRSRRSYKGLHTSEDDVEQSNGKVPNGSAAAPQSPSNGGLASPGAQQHFSYLGCGFARCAARLLAGA